MALNPIGFQLSSFVAGAITDRLGARRAMSLGFVVRSCGIIAFAFLTNPWALAAGSLCVGAGGAMFSPAARAGIAAMTPPEQRAFAFSLRITTQGVGTALGPMLGGFALVIGPAWMFGASAAVYFLFGMAILFLLPELLAGGDRRPTLRQAIAIAARDRAFLHLISLITVQWLLYTQMTITVPLKAAVILSGPYALALLWSLRSAGVILFNLGVPFLSSRLHPGASMSAGALIASLGFGTIAWAGSFPTLLAGVLVCTLGEAFMLPAADTAVAGLATRETLVSYFAFSSATWGIGASLGQYGGGFLVDLGAALGAPGSPSPP